MRASVLDPPPWRERIALGATLLLSVGVHAALAGGAARIPARVRTDPVWVEMVVQVEEPPAPQPEPEPEPTPEPEPEPEPEVVEFEPEPAPEVQPEPKPVPRVAQGLTANSFAQGSGTGIDVRAGTTTAAKAGAVMEIDEATGFATVPFAALTDPPKVKYKPTLEVPQVIIDLEIEGSVEVVMTVDTAGLVVDIAVITSLHPEADRACVDAMRRSRWKAGLKGDQLVTVKGVPYTCRFEMSKG